MPLPVAGLQNFRQVFEDVKLSNKMDRMHYGRLVVSAARSVDDFVCKWWFGKSGTFRILPAVTFTVFTKAQCTLLNVTSDDGVGRYCFIIMRNSSLVTIIDDSSAIGVEWNVGKRSGSNLYEVYKYCKLNHHPFSQWLNSLVLKPTTHTTTRLRSPPFTWLLS